jgi:hypothetical protein
VRDSRQDTVDEAFEREISKLLPMPISKKCLSFRTVGEFLLGLSDCGHDGGKLVRVSQAMASLKREERDLRRHVAAAARSFTMMRLYSSLRRLDDLYDMPYPLEELVSSPFTSLKFWRRRRVLLQIRTTVSEEKV